MPCPAIRYHDAGRGPEVQVHQINVNDINGGALVPTPISSVVFTLGSLPGDLAEGRTMSLVTGWLVDVLVRRVPPADLVVVPAPGLNATSLA